MSKVKFNHLFAIVSIVLTALLKIGEHDGLHPNYGAFALILFVVYIYGRCRLAISEYKPPKQDGQR